MRLMKAIFRRMRNQGRANIFTPRETYSRANGKTILDAEMELLSTAMEMCFEGVGKKTGLWVKIVSCCIKMGMSSKEPTGQGCE